MAATTWKGTFAAKLAETTVSGWIFFDLIISRIPTGCIQYKTKVSVYKGRVRNINIYITLHCITSQLHCITYIHMYIYICIVWGEVFFTTNTSTLLSEFDKHKSSSRFVALTTDVTLVNLQYQRHEPPISGRD